MEHETRTSIKNLNNIRKMVMQENGNRLKTLRLPRDLTLGGSRTKRVFTPNLNAIRNKDRGNSVEILTKPEKVRQSSSHSSKGINKKFNVLQSESVFSLGVGEIKRPNTNSKRNSVFKASNANSKTSLLTVPTITKGYSEINKNEEKRLVEELLADQGTDSESDNEYSSIFLPLEFSNGINQQTLLKSEDISDEIKTEHLHTKPLVNSCISNFVEEIGFTSCLSTPKLFSEDNPAFSFIKLPSSFPCSILKDTIDGKKADYTLSDVQDGLVGKIAVRKSGKMELIFKNNTQYLLKSESCGNTLNDAVLFPGEQSIAIEPSLVTLGAIEETITVSPNWDSLFEQARKNPNIFN